MNPIEKKNFFDNMYQNSEGVANKNPLAAPQRPFDINATDGAKKAQNSFKEKKKGKKQSDEEDDEDEENKPLPRPMGL